MNDLSTLLQPSFLSGWGSIVDIGATALDYHLPPIGALSDELARWADEGALAGDLAAALRSMADRIEAEAGGPEC